MSFSPLALLGLVTVAFGVSIASAHAVCELKEPDRKTVQAGEKLDSCLEPEEGSAWPAITVWRKIEASPEESMALFVDYKHRKDYIRNNGGHGKRILTKSEPRPISARVIQVDYTLPLPFPLPDQNYTMEDTLSYDRRTDVYRADWKKIAGAPKRSVGFAKFEPMGDATLVTYYVLIVPPGGTPGWLKGRAIGQVADTVESLKIEIEKERSEHPDEMAKRIQILREALAQ